MPKFKDKNFEQKPMLKLKSWFFNLYFILYVKIAPAETFTFNWSNCADNANELCEDDDMISSTHICFHFFGPLSQSHSASWVLQLDLCNNPCVLLWFHPSWDYIDLSCFFQQPYPRHLANPLNIIYTPYPCKGLDQLSRRSQTTWKAKSL